jgi:two-component system CheB/CheR fusion protein
LVERHTAHLSHLIDDLLDLSRITAGKIALRMEVFTVQSAIDRAIEINAPAAAKHGHRIQVVASEATALFIRGDLTRITQVLANLLDNAIKYTAEGGRIRLTVVKANTWVLIDVEDNGIGMEPRAIPSMFEIFEQAPAACSAKAGLGIGLSVARSLIQMHDGSISAFSAGPGKGSRFSVRLPLCAPPTCAPVAVEARQDVTHVKRRVLIVDDNEDAAVSLALILDAHEVRVAASGRAALDIALQFRPEAVILDLGLPDISGYELAKHFRRSRQNRKPMLIALTGYGQPEDKVRTRKAGFDHHLVKPASPVEIMALLLEIK